MRANRLAAILSLIAALLAWGGVAVRYFRTGSFDLGIVAAGLFLAAGTDPITKLSTCQRKKGA